MSEGPGTSEVLRAAATRLAEAGIDSARVDAERLATHITGLDRAGLLLAREFPPAHLGAYWEAIERRAERVPLQHIIGETGFRYLTLDVRPGVFVPRPETETVAGEAIDFARALGRPARIVDLCTGAGGIAIACASETDSEVWAVDINPDAVDLTRANATRNNAAVDVRHGDVRDPMLLAELAGTIDVVVSNPPYIPFDAEPIDPEVRDHDPDLALYGGGADGLEVPRAVIDRAHELLRDGGLLVIEHGDDQGAAMREAVRARGGFAQIETRQDLTNRDRMVRAICVKVAD